MKTAGGYDPRELEERILAKWKGEGLCERTLTEKRGKLFSFLEGPPTANTPPALHHVEVRVFKDLVNRFNFMRGRTVPRKAGWDCHGLPVEVQLEKELNLSSKKDIGDFGVDKFVEKCRESVFSHIKEWADLTERMAYWIDLKNPYVTMENDYIESVWWSIAEIHKKGLLYEGHKVVPYCPRCGTPLSSHEVALGYKTLKEETVIVKFTAKDRDFAFLAWTTTPWTLLSNLALAVHPEIDYVKVKYRGEQYVMAKARLGGLEEEAEIVETFKGKELEGVEYHPLFNHFIGKLEKPAWRVILGDFVTTEEGTGIVHIAPAFGEDDYNVGKENDLSLVNPIAEDGKFTEEVPELFGIFAKDADEKIIGILDEMGLMFTKYPYEHEYPYCWRCDTPLLYYAMKSWFVEVTKVKENLLKNNQQISWYPGHIKCGRFGKWLENIKDWSLSRNRFWGTPLPVWKCECGEIEVIGSRAQLAEKAAETVSKDLDMHRPYVDEIKLKCKCGKKKTRVEYVIDCWYDAGSAPYAQFHYPFENKEEFEKRFPYDFICEATDQTRGWFYTMLALSTLLFEKPAYKNCVVGGLLLDDEGEKMSASKGNVLDPWELFNTVGADAVRLQMCSQAPWNARRFGKESLSEGVVPFLRTLWNCYEFTTRYMSLDGYEPAKAGGEGELGVEDLWILSRAETLTGDVTKSLEENNYHTAYALLNEFVVEDLSRWYIKLVRDRLWLEDEGDKMHPLKASAYNTLTQVFEKICLLLSPITPFITEEICQNLTPGESVHLRQWPKKAKSDDKLEAEMKVIRKIFETGSHLRQKAKLKLRHPIQKISIVGDATIEAAVANLSEVIKKQLNSKEVEFISELPGTEYNVSPNFKVLGPKYGKEAKKVAEVLKKNPSLVKAVVDTQTPKKIKGIEVTPEMISEIRITVPKKYTGESFTADSASGVVYIDTERSESLVNEALARDLIRNIQQFRKKHNLEELTKIKVKVSQNSSIEKMLAEFKELVLTEVRGDEIGELTEEGDASFSYNGQKIQIKIAF